MTENERGTHSTPEQALEALSQGRAIAVDALDGPELLQALMFHYNKYRGIKAFLLDINADPVAFKGISYFLVASSPDNERSDAEAIRDLKDWIVKKLAELNNPNITLVISCPASKLYQFADVIDRATPPLANIDFAPLHEFDEVIADARFTYDIMRLESRTIEQLENDKD
jgi:hypothetical protein